MCEHDGYRKQQMNVGYPVVVAQLWRWGVATQVGMSGGGPVECLVLDVQKAFVMEIGHLSY